MKSNFEPLIRDKSELRKKERPSKLNLKTLLTLHISIIIIISLCFIKQHLSLKIKDQMIDEYQKIIRTINKKIQMKELETQSTALQERIHELEAKLSDSKNTKLHLDDKLKLVQSINRELVGSIKLKKRYLELSKASKLLSPMNFEKTEKITKCSFISSCYRMNRDGFSARAFHEQCDGLKPTVTFLKCDSNIIVGGYTRESWDGMELKYDKDAFLFSLKTNTIYFNVESQPAINASPNLLPSFGKDDIFISEKETYHQSNMKSYSPNQSSIPNIENSSKLDLIVLDIEVYHLNCDIDKSNLIH